MATFAELEASLNALTAKVTETQTAVAALQSSSTAAISPAQADTINAGITGATSALTALVTSITPAV